MNRKKEKGHIAVEAIVILPIAVLSTLLLLYLSLFLFQRASLQAALETTLVYYKNTVTDTYVTKNAEMEYTLSLIHISMNTGHDGSLSTGHANSPEGMLSRLETMVLTGSAELPLEAIRQQIASAVDYIVHLSRLRDFSRKCMEITEVTGYKDGRVTLNSIYKFKEDEKSTLKKVSGRLVRTENKIQHQEKFILAGVYDYLEANDGREE